MTIECYDMLEFIQVIAGLVKEGLTFNAHANTLTINLTGGF